MEIKLLTSGNKSRYWKFWKQENCRELVDKQNVEAIFKARQLDVEAIVKRQIEFMNRMLPQGKTVVEHSDNLRCNSPLCITCS